MERGLRNSKLFSQRSLYNRKQRVERKWPPTFNDDALQLTVPTLKFEVTVFEDHN
jgi:hypothetical protein